MTSRHLPMAVRRDAGPVARAAFAVSMVRMDDVSELFGCIAVAACIIAVVFIGFCL